MPDFRAYAPSASPEVTVIRLDPNESHHLIAVNRCQRGDPVVAFDGRGREWTCVCTDPAKAGAVLAVRSTRQATPLPYSIALAQALPKGATMDEIVRQASEIGVARIVPLLSERTQVHLDGDRAEKKTDKWRVTAIEAAKQCGNPWLPKISPLARLDTLLRWAAASPTPPGTPMSGAAVAAGDVGDHLSMHGAASDTTTHPQAAESYDLRLVASLHAGAGSLKTALTNFRSKHGHAPRNVLWLVGPEGDFSEKEMTDIVMAGFVPVTLGPLVLRCDTAAIAALSILSHELQG